MDKVRAVGKLTSLIESIENLKSQKEHEQAFNKWHRDTEIAIEKIFSKDSRHIKDFDEISYSLSALTLSTPDSEFERAYQRGLDTAKTVLTSFIDEINEYWNEGGETSITGHIETLDILKVICTNFHKVVRQLRIRHSNRRTLEIEDEYDVQDLFHALLRIYFEDIRDEEWTPSYAGSCSRVDFLLKHEETIVEIKKTRKGLGAKEVGDQLLVDILGYKAHPSCKTLVCFIYDPEGHIGNPKGIEHDLTRKIDGVDVQVYICPKDI